uniref:Uncharacterized protein n=1 Tax=Anguilla anguilla TaxID=7936 RepID=A0A0E9TCL4_ANGAN
MEFSVNFASSLGVLGGLVIGSGTNQ